MPNFADEKELIWSRIYDMARSGDYPGWVEIEFELRFKDKLAEVQRMLEDPFIRNEIDRLCREARKAS